MDPFSLFPQVIVAKGSHQSSPCIVTAGPVILHIGDIVAKITTKGAGVLEY